MKVIGIGLNKTGTKTLRDYLMEMDFQHQSYSLDIFQKFRRGEITEILDIMENHDSFEDWPWPLMYKEIAKKFKDALFILTVRKSPEAWYKSLCKMAVRMGPFNDFEKHIYGYGMPHGKKKEHIEFYNRHNQEVQGYFKDRTGKLLVICWGKGSTGNDVAQFVGKSDISFTPKHVNASLNVYDGENLWIAHIWRITYQSLKRIKNTIDDYLR